MTVKGKPVKQKKLSIKKHIKEKNTSRLLQYDYTDKETRGLGADIAQLITKLEQSKANEKAVKKQLATEIASHEANMLNISTKINNGYEMRDTPCKIILDYDMGKVTIIRTDINKVVEERAMDDSEIQTEMDFQKAEKEEKEKNDKKGAKGDRKEKAASDVKK